jgi:Na+-translocating ferredoxin:NAD+ oxidoreductase RNF subunit RnfB
MRQIVYNHPPAQLGNRQLWSSLKPSCERMTDIIQDTRFTRNACQCLCVLVTNQVIAGPAKADAARLMPEQRKIRYARCHVDTGIQNCAQARPPGAIPPARMITSWFSKTAKTSGHLPVAAWPEEWRRLRSLSIFPVQAQSVPALSEHRHEISTDGTRQRPCVGQFQV